MSHKHPPIKHVLFASRSVLIQCQSCLQRVSVSPVRFNPLQLYQHLRRPSVVGASSHIFVSGHGWNHRNAAIHVLHRLLIEDVHMTRKILTDDTVDLLQQYQVLLDRQMENK